MIPYRPVPLVGGLRRLGFDAVQVPSFPYISVERNALAVPTPAAYREGDRVKVVAWPRHDPYHANATVEVVHPGPAYGLSIDFYAWAQVAA